MIENGLGCQIHSVRTTFWHWTSLLISHPNCNPMSGSVNKKNERQNEDHFIHLNRGSPSVSLNQRTITTASDDSPTEVSQGSLACFPKTPSTVSMGSAEEAKED